MTNTNRSIICGSFVVVSNLERMVHSIFGVSVQCKNFTLQSNLPDEDLKVILAQVGRPGQLSTRPVVL